MSSHQPSRVPNPLHRGSRDRIVGREQLEQIGSIRDLEVVGISCWLPHDLVRQWLAAHGYRWPAHFDPSPAASPARREDARLRPVRETKLLAVQRYIWHT